MSPNSDGRFTVPLGRLQSLIQSHHVGIAKPVLLSDDSVSGLYKRPFQEQIGVFGNSALPSLAT